MRPELSAALERYQRDPAARRLLLDWRRRTLALSERRELALKLSETGAYRAAALWWISACRQSRGDPRVSYRLANALRNAGRTGLAEKLLKDLVMRYPQWSEPAHSLAWLYRRGADIERAAATMENWFKASGSQFEALFPVSAFLQDMGLIARAQSLLADFPDKVEAKAERGSALVKLGRFDEAEGLLREVVQELPSEGGAWLRLAATQRWRNEPDSPRALMEAGLRRLGLNDETRAAIGFALAKVDDDLERYAEAWQALALANALRDHSAHFNPAAWRESEQTLYRVFTAEFIGRAGAHDGAGEAPIFIVGMPRSGTTLLERRLGRHSALTPGGELEVVENLGIEATGCHGYPAAIAGMTAAMCAEVARLWRSRLPPTLTNAATIIDKNPFNFLHVGWIACLFPNARIIHCRRDPLDTVLSLWFQNFAHKKSDYAYRKEYIAWMYALYRRLMRYWAQVLPGRILSVNYERIVADPETELRGLVQWLGLGWEPGIVGDSSRAEDVISTASVWQARQPVYARSVGRARHYEPWIDEFREALRAAGVVSSEKESGLRA